jgi:hypothetical protein
LGIPIVESTKKTARIPDPPLLTDGNEPRFDYWQMQIKQKLDANADHFSSPALRLAYVTGRCSGDAMKHIAARMRVDSADRYKDAPDVFEHLDSVYGDPNRLVNAKRRYHSLLMKPADKYHTFLSEFLYLAEEADIPYTDRKEDLYNKLTFKLQELVISEANRNGTFAEFNTYCSQTANRLEAILSRQRNRFGRPPASTPALAPVPRATPTPVSAPRQTSFEPKRGSPSSNPRLPDAERESLLREGRCFTCKMPGHLSRDCPSKQKTTVATTSAELVENEETDNEKSGKVAA